MRHPLTLARPLALLLLSLASATSAAAAPQVRTALVVGPDGPAGHGVYTSIQMAIDDAPEHVPSRILVGRGTYEENLDFLGKPIVLEAVDGARLTKLRGDGTEPVVRMESGEPAPTALIGFTIVGGHGGIFGGGVRIEGGADVAVLGCRFGDWNDDDPNAPFVESNFAGLGGGLYCRQSELLLANCTFWQNQGLLSGAAVFLDGGARAQIVQCTMSGNVGPGGTALSLSIDAQAQVFNSILWDNLNTDIAVGASASVEFHHCTISLGEWTGAGSNLSSIAPRFVDAAVGDLRLLPDSPCIDAGDTLALPQDLFDLDGDGDLFERLPIDLDGGARVVDAPWAANLGVGLVDQGAFEVPGALGRAPSGTVNLP